MSTATWVAGTPKASIPDFTEPPKAPECSSVLTCTCGTKITSNDYGNRLNKYGQKNMNTSYKSDDWMPECV